LNTLFVHFYQSLNNPFSYDNPSHPFITQSVSENKATVFTSERKIKILFHTKNTENILCIQQNRSQFEAIK